MKKKKTVIILCTFLILLIGVYAVIMINNKKQNEKEPAEIEQQETKVLVNLNKEDIVRLSYTKQDSIMEFEKQEDIWVYQLEPELPVRQNYITNMIGIFTNLTSDKTVEETTQNLEEYGLEKPTYTITVTTEEQKETTLYVGIKNPMTSDYYIYIEGVAGIYMIPSTMVEYFDYSLYDMAEAEIFPTISSSAISELSLKWNEKEITLKTLEESSYDISNLMSWYITSPFEHEIVADAALIETQLQKIADIIYAKLAAFRPTQEQLQEMGLTNPIGRISFHYTEQVEAEKELTSQEATNNSETVTETEVITVPKTYTMLIGNSNGGEYYYAMEEGSDRVNFISASTIDAIMSYTANDYIYKYFALVNIETVEEVLLQEEDMIYRLGNIPKNSSQENETIEESSVLEEEQEEKESEIRSFYQSIIGISAEKVIDMPQEAINWLPFKVIFKRNAGKEDIILEFSVYNTNFYLASVNGEARYLVNKRDFENYKSTILEGFQKFSE